MREGDGSKLDDVFGSGVASPTLWFGYSGKWVSPASVSRLIIPL